MAPPSAAVEPYLPSVQRARAEGLTARRRLWRLPFSVDLLAATPDVEIPLAAVVVDARVQAREMRDKRIQIPAAAVHRLPREAPPLPHAWTHARSRFLLERDAEPSDCGACEFRRGRLPCTACGGTGRFHSRDSEGQVVVVPCSGCDKGYVICATCDGHGDAVWARVMDVVDLAPALRYAYLPSMTDALDLAVGPLFEDLPPALPDALRFDPDPQRQQSAYRGDTRQHDARFEGHGFGDALPRALSAIAGLGGKGERIRQQLVTHAWPLLWLRYRSLRHRGDVCLLVSPHDHRLTAVAV